MGQLFLSFCFLQEAFQCLSRCTSNNPRISISASHRWTFVSSLSRPFFYISGSVRHTTVTSQPRHTAVTRQLQCTAAAANSGAWRLVKNTATRHVIPTCRVRQTNSKARLLSLLNGGAAAQSRAAQSFSPRKISPGKRTSSTWQKNLCRTARTNCLPPLCPIQRSRYVSLPRRSCWQAIFGQ